MENSNPFIKKIRQLTVSFSFLFLLIQTAAAQNITRIEYYYDTDPGFGLGTAVTFTPAANVSSLAFSASISALSSGFHTLYVRSRDANNKWSLTNNQPFIKYAAQGGPSSAANINKMEYFVDTDPGIGLATNVSVTAAQNISGQVFAVPLASLSYGFHTLYVRTRDANNKWSLTNYGVFIKYQSQSGPSAAANINKMEYFVDADPGIGLATNVPVTPAQDISGQVIAVPLASLSFGFHTLYVRTRDANNKWSLTNYGVFIKYQSQTGPSAAGNINKMEYFVDADPGFGLATNVPVTTAPDIAGQVVSVPITSYAYGFHTIYFRTRDTNGKWSLTNYGVFIRYQAQTGPSAAGNIVKLEYFVDADPGFGLGTNVPVTPALDISGQVVNVSISALSNGFHTIYLRSKDSNSKWSLTNYGSFIKYAAQTGPLAAGNIIKMEYFVDTDPGFGNGGNIPFTHSTNVVGLVANIDLTSVANGFHTMYIRSMDTLRKWSLTNRATFTGGQLQAPTASITVNGPSTFCLGAGTYLSANYSASATYQWKLGGTNINGATGITYVPTQTGSYTVVVTNAISSATSSAVSITVNPVPTATISANGVLTFCQGGSVTMSVNATANATYQWHINGSNIGGATTTSYVASQSGVFDVAVTSTNGCATTSAHDTVTVNPSATATITPSGATTFCTGDSVMLYGNTGSGLTYHWSNNATTSSIKVLAQGNYSLTVTNSYTCSASAAAIAVTVLTAPTATITPNGPTTFCNGSSVILAANTGSGLSYLWSGGAITSSITVTSSGTYYVTVSNAGCSKVSSPVTVTVNPGPLVGVSATASTICQGHTDTLTASGATTYAWSPGTGLNTTTGAVVYATPGSSITYTVTGTTSGCIGTASYTVNISPNNTSVSTTTPTICSGSSAVLNAFGANTYTWSPSGTLSSSTGASVTATPLAPTTYTVTGTSGSCTSTATVTINVNTTVVPSVAVSASQTTICAGTSVTVTALPTNGGASPTYLWYKNGVLQAGSTNAFTSSSLANNDSVWCIMTSNAACPLPATATSNKVHMTVNPVVVPTISIAVTQNPVCVGDSVTFTATITNGGANPVYQWKKNNVTVGSNSATYKLVVPVNNDSVWCILTSNALCASPASITSSKIKMVVNQIATPTVTVSASQNPICTGASIIFSAVPTNGGTTPAYQWYKNGNTVGINSNSYTDNGLSNNDSVWCVMTSNATCASPLTVTGNKVVIVIAPQVTPSVIVSTTQTSVCAGTSVTFTAAPTNGGASPTYQWYKNGVVQAGNTNTYINTVVNNDSVWCIMTSNATCPVPTTGTSNKVHMTVNPTVTPTISITGLPNPICAGASVTFTATITNGGTTPVYQWMKNNVSVGTGATTFVTTALANNDSVWCVLTSNAPCPSSASVTSNKVHMTVNPIVTPTISVNASQNPICTGASVTFTASVTNGGSTPVYQWYKNGATVGSSIATYSFGAFASTDSVWCVLTSNANCTSTSTATSNKVIIIITPTVVPSVTVNAGQNPICAGSSATFTASATNGGASPTYQWYKNGVLQAGNTSSYSNAVANNDSVWCIMTSNAQCPSPATGTSNKVHMTVNPIVVPTISIVASQNPICAGDSVTFTATITNGGANPAYQWKKNNVNVGNGTAIYGITTLANNDSIWCIFTSNAPCPSPVSITSSKVKMIVNPITSPAVSITASQNNVCAGTGITFTAVPVNGGSTPVYTWFKNGTTVGTNSVTYSDNTLANSDSVWCVIASNKTCVFPNTATSNKVVMTIISNVVPAVTVAATQTTFCLGTSITFTASPTNGGTSPGYQWYKNGIVQSGNTGSYANASLANNDSVWCVMTSHAVCPLPVSATSNAVTVSVLQPSHYSFSQSICQGESYQFHSMNLTAGGNYNDTLVAANGCDSIITLSLTVNQVVTTNINTHICNGSTYSFNGQTLSVGGTYNDTLSSVAGCDSFIVLHLQVVLSHTDSSSASVCQGDVYNFYGQSLTAAGVYRDTLTSSLGCDSIQVLSLSVHQLPVAVVTITGNDTLRTTTFSKYQWLLNNVVLAADTNKTLIALVNGSYSVLVTDSSGCSDTSSIVSVTGVGIAEVPFVNLMIYPNPTENMLNVHADNLTEVARIELRDDLGRLLYEREIRGNAIREELDLSNYASGVYLLMIKNSNKTFVAKRVFKN